MSIENVDLFDGLSPDELQLLRDTSVVGRCEYRARALLLLCWRCLAC